MRPRPDFTRVRRVYVLSVLISLIVATAGVLPATARAQILAPAQYVERDSIRIVYFGDDARAVAERTLAASFAPLHLPGIPEAAVLPKSTIILAPDEATFDSLAFGRPDWAAGIAIPSRQLIILPTYQRTGPLSDPIITLRHELAHLALNAYLGGRVPRWFDEGYATWVSGGWDAQSGWQIRLALLRGQAPPFDSLTLAWPRQESRARLAYLLSASAVMYLAESRGYPAFEAFFERWREEGSFEPAFRATYQMTFGQFEREWRAMVRRRYGWLLAISQTAVFWLFVVLLVLILGSRRRRMNRERLEALRREEYMLPPRAGPDRDGLLE